MKIQAIALRLTILSSVILMATLFVLKTREFQDESSHSQFNLIATQAAALANRDLAMRVVALKGLVAEIESEDIDDDIKFDQHASIIRQTFPDFLAINRMNAERIITKVTPLQGNESALGRKVGQTSDIVSLLDDAEKSREPRATDFVQLFQGGKGVAIYIPYYLDGHLAGFVNAVFRVEEVIRIATMSVDPTINIEMPLRSSLATHASATYQYAADVNLLNRSWNILISPDREQAAKWGRASRWIVYFGVLFGLIVVALFIQLGLQHRRTMAENDRRLQAEERLRKSESRYRSIIEGMDDVYFETDQNGTFTFVSPSSRDILGFEPDELIGETSNILFVDIVDKDKLIQKLRLHRNQVRNWRIQSRHKNRNRIWISMSAHLLRDHDGKNIGLAGTVREITNVVETEEARHAAEELKSSILDSMSGNIAVLDADGKILAVNKGWKEFAKENGAPPDLILGNGQDYRAACRTQDGGEPNQSAKSASEGIADVLTHKRSTYSQEYRCDSPSEPRWYRMTVTPLTSPRGGAVISHQDITELKLANEKLHQAQKMEAVGQLTGGVAHDFNNLLAVIMGNLELLERKDVDESARKHLIEPALRATQRGAELTRQLLAFSRRQTLRSVPVDFAELAANFKNLLARTLGEQVEWLWDLPSGLAKCFVDPAQLESALLNLALNSRDAMPTGGIIKCSARNISLAGLEATRLEVKPGNYLKVVLEDSGHGMTASVMQKAIEPFFTTKDVGKGSGLGLSMIYGFVRQSGGNLTIESQLGSGTVVTLYLPQVAEESTNPTSDMSISPASFSGTVLVVEDEKDVGATAVELLQYLGFEVLHADSGASALPMLVKHKNKIKILFSDVVLGKDMSGQISPNTPRISFQTSRSSSFLAIRMPGKLESKPCRMMPFCWPNLIRSKN